jgi:hypothetical protein
MIAYLLEYYSGHATDCAGWMSTVSKALPLLFKYNYGLLFYYVYFSFKRIVKFTKFMLF